MDILARFVVLLATTNVELVILKRDLDLVLLETRYRQRDAQQLTRNSPATILADLLAGLVANVAWVAADSGGHSLNIVGWIAIAALANAVDQALHFLEAQQ
jgi:hypothetical protein